MINPFSQSLPLVLCESYPEECPFFCSQQCILPAFFVGRTITYVLSSTAQPEFVEGKDFATFLCIHNNQH